MAIGKGLIGLLIGYGACSWALAQEPGGLWQPAGEVGLRVGYNDNVTLSSANAEASSFLGAAFDGILWQEWGDGFQFEGFVLGEQRQYLDSEQVDKEQLLYGLVQVHRDWNKTWHADTGFEYFYQDQVIDVAATETNIQPARIQGHTFTGRIRVKRELGGGWLQLELAGTRQLFEELIDDYWEFTPGLEWTWPVQQDLELSLGYQYVTDWYDEDPALASEGEPIPGTQREAGRHEVVLSGRKYFGNDRQWRLTLRLSGRINQDTTGDYYDYVRPQASFRLRYRSADWEVEGGLRLNHYDYGVQTVAVGDPELRKRSELYCDVRVKRRIARRLHVVAEYNYEQTFSNRSVEQYAVNTVSGGITFEF
jgi:hypothetical protein